KRQMDGTVLMKTDGNGLIPCKNPGTLTKLLPTLLIQSRTPVIASGVYALPAGFVVLSAMTDTASLCTEEAFPLPVELIAFIAERHGEKNDLDWTTASEINNDYFAVQRSSDGKSFSDCGIVQGAGNSATQTIYTFSDDRPLQSPVSYYRLKQVDFDGV